MSTATITNVGPVKNLLLDVPENGGLVVLRGKNGSGKSRSLEAIESVLTGKGSLDVRDGALNGKVDAFGVTITVGRNTRRKGELEVESLSSKLNLSELIEPGLKTADAADAKRIKALCSVAGAKADDALFHGLVGGKEAFEKIVSVAAVKADDIIVMADRIKRDLEAEARREEDAAEKAEGVALGAKNATAGIDVSQPCDSAKLQSDLEQLIKYEAEVCERLKAHVEASKKAGEAEAKLIGAQAEYTGLSLHECQVAEVSAKTQVDFATEKLREAEQVWREAKSIVERANNTYANAISQRKNAEQHESMVSQWKQQIATSIPPMPTDEEISSAKEAVKLARQAVEQGALIRQAKQQVQAMQKAMSESVQHRSRSAMLREAAKGTDEVLSGVVGKLGTKLRVEAGRLVLDTHRGATYYDDLSAGERAKIAIDIGIDAVGEHGVLTISQEIYEGLDGNNRRMIAEHAEQRGVVILTAEASDDEEITAEVFE